jgi:DNA-binding GntR family transcriptional regulator
MGAKPYYEIIRDTLLRNIEEGRLPAGTRLQAAALADRLAVSRSPIKRALDLLAEEGQVLRLDGQGYAVPPLAEAPVRRNLHLLDLDLGGRESETLVAPSWERIVEEVERAVQDCAPFGAWQISEAVLGEHFAVSRTVIREALARLNGRGLIHKDRASHWIAGPLSAQLLADSHAIRRQLEPRAVAEGAARVPRSQLLFMRAALRTALEQGAALSQAEVEGLEDDLHGACVAAGPNRLLAEAVRSAQVARVVNRLFGTHIGIHDERPMLSEHRLVLDHLLVGDRDGAEAAMRFHLEADHERARARLKVLSVFDTPAVAPYLTKLH